MARSEEKVLLQAVRSIKPANRQIRQFVETGRKKIVDYYEQECDVILERARLLAAGRQYGKAFFELSSIPAEASSAYRKMVPVALDIFASYVDYEGEKNLAKARSAWMAEQNASGAGKAGQYLERIYPDAACYPAAESLYREIKAKVREDWAFEMKQYDDSVSLESQRIDAMRQIGVAYGSHQTSSDYHVTWLVK
ncbi:MAG: hypothetical protein IJ721_04760 [Bacteroidales bacterium]|nr:hypothetical protein [Bacteroidales bacterium]